MISVVNNVIYEMSNDDFHGLNLLTALKLRQCRLNEMPPVDTVKDTLHTLILYDNSITTIPHDYFDAFTVLKELSLSYNRLIAIPDVSQVRLTIRILRVSYNNIHSISSAIVDDISPQPALKAIV